MDKFFEKLYNGFLLRDVLSFLFPGAILVIVAFLIDVKFHNIITIFIKENINTLKPFINKEYEITKLGYILLIFICYTVGTSINFIRDRFVFYFLYKDNSNTSWFQITKKVKHWYAEYKKFASSSEDSEKATTERFIVLIQFSGNVTISILLSAIIFISNWCGITQFSVFIVSVALFCCLAIFSVVKFKELIEFVRTNPSSGKK